MQFCSANAWLSYSMGMNIYIYIYMYKQYPSTCMLVWLNCLDICRLSGMALWDTAELQKPTPFKIWHPNGSPKISWDDAGSVRSRHATHRFLSMVDRFDSGNLWRLFHHFIVGESHQTRAKGTAKEQQPSITKLYRPATSSWVGLNR